MQNEPNPIVEQQCELIRKHSERIRKAQKELREAIEAAIKDRINFDSLYI